MLLDLLFTEFGGNVLPGYALISDGGNQLNTCDVAPNCINKYLIGNLVRLSVQFLDFQKNPIDPTFVTLLIRNPDYTDVDYEYGSSNITRTGTGTYYFDLPLEQMDYYNWEWAASGNVVAATAGQLESIASVFQQ